MPLSVASKCAYSRDEFEVSPVRGEFEVSHICGELEVNPVWVLCALK